MSRGRTGMSRPKPTMERARVTKMKPTAGLRVAVVSMVHHSTRRRRLARLGFWAEVLTQRREGANRGRGGFPQPPWLKGRAFDRDITSAAQLELGPPRGSMWEGFYTPTGPR